MPGERSPHPVPRSERSMYPLATPWNEHTAAPARASAPRLTSRLPLGSVLPGQCRALDAIRRTSAVFVWRQPGAKPKSSPPGPRTQVSASSSLLAIPGPGSHHRSAPSERLSSAGPSAHQPGARESGGPEELPSRRLEGAQRAGALSRRARLKQKKRRGAAARSSRRSGPPKLPCTLVSSPSRPGAGAAPLLPHAHCRSQRAHVTTGARPTNTDPASGRSQQPNPAHVMSLGSPEGCLRGPLPSMPPVG
ncbi:hypothetical protein NDU88_003483 [Pleurodeles waltl]|uniref:Uncharacterized protein n=1 Tax=Pleurodeles waltl TaxID=8319 RepID=A0AAV7T6T3_PLEWA|nr:hypothetical protein NDU88_003483 [Pleurodeles waltl]